MKTLVPMRFAETPLLWTVDNVYTENECADFVEKIKGWEPTIATNNPLYRNQDRVMRDDPEMAADLLERLRARLPERMGELSLLGLNERFRFYRYAAGQDFKEHMDHWHKASPTKISLLTVLVYFNSDFEGGETAFSEQLVQRIEPQAGRVAIFQHKVRHEGCPVIQGQKFLVRTDVMYLAPSKIQLTYDS